jgi:hemerythrin
MADGTVKIIEWTPEYSVHVAEIDREHQTFFSAINRLHEAMLAGKGTAILEPLLSELSRYTHYHFAHEESLMANLHYPDAPSHIEKHEALRCKVAAFVERFRRGEATMTIELTIFLTEWLKQHIVTTDRQFGAYIGTRTRRS